jgi:hypothetical protein
VLDGLHSGVSAVEACHDGALVREDAMRIALAGIAALALSVTACATTAPTSAPSRPPPISATGGFLFLQDGTVQWTALFSNGRVAFGRSGGPFTSWLDRTPTGTWKGTVLAERSDGMEAVPNVVEVAVEGNRITGPGIDVTIARVGGGFRLDGMWMKGNVDLLVTPTEIRGRSATYSRVTVGEYRQEEFPQYWIRLTGEAVGLEAPPFPEIALSALISGLGVRTLRRGPYG